MNESIPVRELALRLRRSDLVATTPDKVGPQGGYCPKLAKFPG